MRILAKNLGMRIASVTMDPRNIKVLDTESTKCSTTITTRECPYKSPGYNWDYELIADSGADASLVLLGGGY